MKDEQNPDMRETVDPLEGFLARERRQQLQTRLSRRHQSGLTRDAEFIGIGRADETDGVEMHDADRNGSATGLDECPGQQPQRLHRAGHANPHLPAGTRRDLQRLAIQAFHLFQTK